MAAEWWKSDVEAVINQAMKLGRAPNVSDAHTINGHPGPLLASSSSSNCSSSKGNIYHFNGQSSSQCFGLVS